MGKPVKDALGFLWRITHKYKPVYGEWCELLEPRFHMLVAESTFPPSESAFSVDGSFHVWSGLYHVSIPSKTLKEWFDSDSYWEMDRAVKDMAYEVSTCPILFPPQLMAV